jgi:hypothetical protein
MGILFLEGVSIGLGQTIAAENNFDGPPRGGEALSVVHRRQPYFGKEVMI